MLLCKVFDVLFEDGRVLIACIEKCLEDLEEPLQQESYVKYFALWVLLRALRVRLEDNVATVLMDPAQALVEEALDVFEVLQRGLEVVRNRIDPIFSVRVRLYFLPVLVIFKRYVKLEALRLAESRLQDRISGHVHNVVLVELLLGVLLQTVVNLVIGLSVHEWLARRLENLLHGESELLLALLDGRGEDLAHRVLELDLDDALELLHRLDELIGDLDVHVLLLMMRHLILPLGVQLVDISSLFIDDGRCVIFAVKATILDILDELAQGERVLLLQVVQFARLRELKLQQALLEVLLLEPVAHLEDFELVKVPLVQLDGHLVEPALEVTLTLRDLL